MTRTAEIRDFKPASSLRGKPVARIVALMIWWCVLLCAMSALAIKTLIDAVYKGTLRACAYILEACTTCSSFLENNPRVRVITDRGDKDPYLLRYYLFLQDRKSFPFNIFIHRFEKGDEDDLHDHPWGFFHLILSGGYWEYVTVNEDGKTLDRGVQKVWRGPGHWKFADASYKHRVELGSEKPWTIFVPFKQENRWGFWVETKRDDTDESIGPAYTWHDHEKYLAEKASQGEDAKTK